MVNNFLKLFCFCLINSFANAQASLTGSPYSLFGLGVESNSNTGRNSAMGKTGIALESPNQINLYNPASLVTIDRQRFIFDVGFLSDTQNITSNGKDEKRFSSNVSNITFGFNGNGKYGVALSLRPTTSVGYSLIGIESTIEGSNEQFLTNIQGYGGLNELKLDYGRKISNNFNLGVSLSYLFGNINETESAIAENTVISVNDISSYTGFLAGIGVQYRLNNYLNFGLTTTIPTALSGRQNTYSEKTTLEEATVLDETIDKNINEFKLPFKLGVGISTRFKSFLISADYNTNFWDSTNQSDGEGTYIDQHIFALGAEYVKDPESINYWERISLRTGINYNSGYLEVDDKSINSFSASIGIGLPVGKSKGSNLNISYNYGLKGTTDSFLIHENFNTININLTFSNIWFRKKLIR